MKDIFLSSIDSHWENLLREGKELYFQAGQVLFYEGHNPYGIFVLLTGDVHFSREVGTADDHRESFSKGVVLGLEAFLEEKPYCCTCTASRPTQVVFISKTQLSVCLPYDLAVSSHDERR